MVGDIISVLGFLRDISDASEREQKEKQLFDFVKALIIEFLEQIDSEEKRKAILTEYQICSDVHCIGGSNIADHLDQYDNIALYFACTEIIQIKYKLTDKQLRRIIDIIQQIKPKIIENTYINFGLTNKWCDIVILRPSQDVLSIDREQVCFINLKEIPVRVSEIRQGDWDSFIFTAIKELG